MTRPLRRARPVSDATAVDVTRGSTRGRALGLVLDTYAFIRFAAIGFTILMPLLGAVTGTASPSIGWLCVLGVSYHVFAFVLNDVIDLPVDRTDPERQVDPLVRGVVRPRTALVVALAQIPIGFALVAALDGATSAYAAYATALAGMAIYDLWGKKGFVPLATDIIQGLAWGALVVAGAALANGAPTSVSLACAAAVVVFILLINGVHGSVRDLGNDIAAGALTMAIALGARTVGDSGLHLSPAIRAYALGLQIALLAAVSAMMTLAWPRYSPTAQWLAPAALGLIAVASLVVLVVTARRAHDRSRVVSLGVVHMLLCLASIVVPLVPLMAPASVAAVTLAFVIPPVAMFARKGVRQE